MSDGERVQHLIYDWLERNFPDDKPIWYDRRRMQSLALEIKMIPAFGAIEYNISNGGWAQFLWNCFGYWRDVINIAKDGYLLIGAPEQSAALTELGTLCERDERECGETHERAQAAYAKDPDSWSPFFAKFTSRSYSAPSHDWEELFWSDELYDKRLTWLAANEARVREAIKASEEKDRGKRPQR
jgi:hypothetical protein